MDPSEIDDALKSRFLARSSLAPSALLSWMLSTISILVVATAASFAGKRLGMPAGPVAIGMWTGIILSFVVPGRVLRAAHVRWLAALDLPLDRISYLDALNVSASGGALVLELQLEGGATVPADQIRAKGAVQSEPGLVRITSPWFVTMDQGSAGSWKNNGPLHRWFRGVADEVLVPLSRANPIKSIVARHSPPDPAPR